MSQDEALQSDVPPSPGVGRVQFADGKLEDTMAAEFHNFNSIAVDAERTTDAIPLEVESDHGLSAKTMVAPTVNEIEKQCPSTLRGDILQNAINIGNGEGFSGQRLLAVAAKRHANAVQRNPQDYNALYNWALVLQESAASSSAEASGAGKDRLLEEACAKYKAATDLCPTLGEAFYNWAIAISDRAKARGRTKEAEDLWKEVA